MIGTTKNVNLDVLSADIANLLVVLDIPKVHAVVGVGLGGLTALAFASRYPDKLDRFIACDFDLASTRNSESNWDSSLHYARTYGMGGVGAAKLIANWFTADSRGSTQWESVRKMIASASLEGMEAAVRAFYGYDETAKIGEIRVPGLFVVGAEDRVRPEEMGAFPEKMAKGMGRLEVVERAGHFPMMENTEAFVRAVEGFLGGAVATSI
ncbi:hypothetical protein MMC08_004552 [Hypocenomyce scalaris]|nr:hypothetical protein [Hypocenomyce scalaris]